VKNRAARLTYAHFSAPPVTMRVLGKLRTGALIAPYNLLIYNRFFFDCVFGNGKNPLQKNDLTQLS
jgi:hypothetical protein